MPIGRFPRVPMLSSTLIELGWSHVRNALAEAVYTRTGADYTRPVSFHALVLEECNAKCRFCDYWRLDEHREQMSIAQWQDALTEIKDFVGVFHVNFSGGEPFAKRGFVDLLSWCGEHGILAGVTTNGSVMGEEMAARVVAARPFNVNFSLDAPTPALHDYLRGVPGLFRRVQDGIRNLQAAGRDQGVKTRIVLKMCVMAANFEEMPAMARWAREMGVNGLLFQPVQDMTPEVGDELWIEQDQHARLAEVIEECIAMRKDGWPILSSAKFMRLMLSHFRGEAAPPSLSPCHVGLRSLHIQPDGEVELCYRMPGVGNLREQGVRPVWRGEAARAIRKRSVACPELCLCTGGSMLSAREKCVQLLRLAKS